MSNTIEIESEVIQSITQLAQAAQEHRIIKELSNPFREVVVANGGISILPKDPPPANPVFRTPADMRSHLEHLAHCDLLHQVNSCILVGEQRVTFFEDISEVRRCCTTPLTLSLAMKWLSCPTALRQPDFVKLLRSTLEGALPDGNLLSRVRSVKFSVGTQAVGTVRHGQESIDRSMLAQIEDSSTIPEEVTLSVLVYQQTSIRYPVRCTLDVDAQAQEFRLAPLPQEVWNATTAALSSIADSLRFEGGPMVLLGDRSAA